MNNEELTKEIERMQKEFAQERKLYLKTIGEIIRHFVPNEEQLEAIQADFLKRIEKDSDSI